MDSGLCGKLNSDVDSDNANSNTTPAISVGMPVYNGERFIEPSIQSILDQTFEDFELIISDNASSDSTEQICRDYASRDSRIRYYRNTANIGAAANYNRLFELARGEFFRWSNADDLVGPDLHELCVNTLRENSDAVLCYCKTAIIDEHGKTTDLYEDNLHLPQDSASERFIRFFKQVGLTNAIYGLMRKEALLGTNLFGDGTVPAADVGFMAELTLRGSFLEIPDTQFYRRMHTDASSYVRENDEVQQMFWRAEPTPFKLPTLRQNIRYLQSIWKSDNKFTEKGRLLTYVMRQIMWQRSKIASEIFALRHQ